MIEIDEPSKEVLALVREYVQVEALRQKSDADWHQELKSNIPDLWARNKAVKYLRDSAEQRGRIALYKLHKLYPSSEARMYLIALVSQEEA